MTISLTAARLRKVLVYNPRTGIFRWRAGRMGGLIAGWNGTRGYRCVKIDDRKYKTARLVFMWMTGRFPRLNVDHIDGNHANDKWSNLREANQSQNIANSRARMRALPKGVKLHSRGKYYVAQICVNYQTIHLGCFDDPEMAHAAYLVAARTHFGRFARAS